MGVSDGKGCDQRVGPDCGDDGVGTLHNPGVMHPYRRLVFLGGLCALCLQSSWIPVVHQGYDYAADVLVGSSWWSDGGIMVRCWRHGDSGFGIVGDLVTVMWFSWRLDYNEEASMMI